MSRIANWVKESVSGTPGTGSVTLGGAVAGFRRFQDVAEFTSGDYLEYFIEDGDNKEWGIGHFFSGTPWTFDRYLVKATIDAGVYDDTAPTEISLTSAAIVSIAPNADSTGMVIGMARAEEATLTDITSAAIPFDNTLPADTEGTELLTVAYTPKFDDSKVHVEATITGSTDGAATVVAALFRDAGGSAVSATAVITGGAQSCQLHLVCDAGFTVGASNTWKLRVGVSTGHFYVNGDTAGTQVFGGVSFATLKVTEYRSWY